MTERSLSQKGRFLILIAEVVLLCLANYIAFDTFLPSSGDKGFWFYSALLGLVLGSRLDTPFFARPADVVLYAAPAAIALLLGSSWQTWDSGEKVAFVIALAFCVAVAIVGAIAIVIQDTPAPKLQRVSNTARVLAETFGHPRVLFTVVVAFALYAYHRNSAKEIGVIVTVWALAALLSPLEAGVHLFSRLRRIWQPGLVLDADGEVLAFQTPGIILIRQSPKSNITAGSLVAIQDSISNTRVALVLDRVGRDEGILVRTIEINDLEIPLEVQQKTSNLPSNSVAIVTLDDSVLLQSRLLQSQKTLVGLVAPESSIATILFEVVNTQVGLEEGRLVEVQVGIRTVTYQVVNGLTKEEIIYQKNTFGYARAQAQKIGEWDDQNQRFRLVKWLPEPNSPVFLKTASVFAVQTDAIGHLPGTDYPATLRKQDGRALGLECMVTHNTAILGILGIGKTSAALEIVERLLVNGIKVICLDLTNQYAAELAPYYDAEAETACITKLQALGQSGKQIVKTNVEEGGSRKLFKAKMTEDLKKFVDPENGCRLKIFNPAQFEVWKQDSKPYQGNASMASLSPAEITHIISEATLTAVEPLGMTDRARVCLVYEEAHSLIPEWNSSVVESDRAASNGTARAILQGRKYGLGCVLITQRTANVPKRYLINATRSWRCGPLMKQGKNSSQTT
jgi:hypothetical protein